MKSKAMEQIEALMTDKGPDLTIQDIKTIRKLSRMIDPDENENYSWIEEGLFLIENDTMNQNFFDTNGNPLKK